MKKLVLLLLLLFAPWSQAANYMCGQDLNGDGYVDSENETASCTVSTSGQYCPIGAAMCQPTETTTTADYIYKCPPGSTESNGKCLTTYNPPCNSSHPGPFTTMSRSSGQWGGWMYTLGSWDVVIMLSGKLVTRWWQSSLTGYRAYGQYCYRSGGNERHNGGGEYWRDLQRAPLTVNTYTDKIKTCPPDYEPNGGNCSKVTTVDVCPTDNNLACVGNGTGSTYCSPNPCVDLDTTNPIEHGEFDDTMLVDDGERDENGACLDQLYIFNGKHSECKPAGKSTGFKNCCSNKGSALHDGAGSLYSVYGGITTVKKLYTIAKVAYVQYNAAIAAGETAAGAANFATGAAQTQAGLMFNPTTLAIGVAMYFVMDYLMQACDKTDLEAAMLDASGYCHYIGEYCKEEWPLIGCVQKAKSFCCFNSKLARIIHQQGRPQLTTFNAWGRPESPDCRGFKPEEFQSLDFSRIDLTEYYDDLVHKTQKEMADTMKKVSEEFYEHTISNANK